MCSSCKCLRQTVLIFVLQNKLAVMGHDGPSLPFDFKFLFQNESVLIKSNLINEMTKDFLKMFHNLRDQEEHQKNFNDFSEKTLILGN